MFPERHALRSGLFQYLERRFCRSIRTVAACIFVVKTLCYLGIVLYAPALTISTLTPLPIWASIVTCGGFATIWTIKVILFYFLCAACYTV